MVSPKLLLDTNILLAALIDPDSLPAEIQQNLRDLAQHSDLIRLVA